jgi:hypothetical protein
MVQVRLFLLVVLSVLAVGAVATTSASAYDFVVEGSAVSSPVNGTLKGGTSTLKGELLGLRVEVISTSNTGQFSIGPAGTSTYEISYAHNTIKEAGGGTLTNCTVQNLITFDGADDLAGASEGGGLWDEFAGSAPPLLVKIKLTGSSCALKGTYALEGTMDALLPTAETEEVTHTYEFLPESESLTLGGSPATLTDTEELSLSGSQSGKKWRVTSWLGTKNVGGSALEEQMVICYFTAISQKCQIRFTNISGEELEITGGALITKGTSKWTRITPTGCKGSNKLAAAEGTCVEEVELNELVEKEFADVCLYVKNVGGVERMTCAVLRTKV